LNLTPDFINLS